MSWVNGLAEMTERLLSSNLRILRNALKEGGAVIEGDL